MNVTRRDALLGLFGMSSAVGLGGYGLTADSRPQTESLSRREIESLLTVADAVHPSDPSRFEPLVADYVDRLSDDRIRGLLRTLSELDRVSYSQVSAPFRSLSGEEGKRVFETLGVHRVQSRPRGTLPERIRFHLVNSILYAVLTDPRGTEPFGIENPVGYPGGFSSYTRE